MNKPDSAESFGTGKAVKVSGTVDGHDYEASMLPLRKEIGDEVTVRLTKRIFQPRTDQESRSVANRSHLA
ncbi:DUF1905 domain-containing protein [Amycolatopsis sp. QT-25]|uniref:DUF1905 domain-containing protein n=1 Tax=Amycolatopsis sp. QT-25 TaxID=3034022 RepID=UPI0023ECC050|nr:DUF1905 domain-containing protein [Amycolatopsis sp. QT-25]WET78680.1 DUF1905 domain-containing protein [Amycolatopsis sp. QT-25]